MPPGQYVRTPEMRKKISMKKKKDWKDPDTKYNSPKYRKEFTNRLNELWADPTSKYYSKEYRKKLSDANSGNKHYLFGKHHTKQSKDKIRKSTTGKKNHFYGKNHSQKSKNKSSVSLKARRKDPLSKYNSIEYKINRKKVMLNARKYIKYEDTKIEKIIKHILKRNHIKFKTQKWMGQYRVDFFIPKHNLIIEADGTWSHGDPRIFKSSDIIQGHKTAKEKWAFDKNRDKTLKNNGYKIIRFWEKEIKKEPKLIEETIKNTLF